MAYRPLPLHLSSSRVCDADMDAEMRDPRPLLDVVPLLNRRDVWRGLANVFVACVARTEPHVRGFSSESATRMTHSAASEPTVSDPAAAAALRCLLDLGRLDDGFHCFGIECGHP